jgi:hypothetical protein
MARKLQADEWLFAGTVALALFGVIMVYSASAVVAAGENHSQYHYVIRQGIWTLVGLGAMYVGMRLDYGLLRNAKLAYALLGLTAVLLVAVFAFPPINGARRWIRFAGFSLQPSEISKLALAIFLARFLERRAGREGDFLRTFVPAVFVTGVLALLIVAEPDLGTSLMLAVVCTVMLFTAGARLKHMALAEEPGRIVLILGGRGKNAPYAPLAPLVRRKARSLVVIGEDAERIEAELKEFAPTSRASDMADAVQRAYREAEPGDMVLLAPACASFDMFTSYEHRGRVFKEEVGKLKNSGVGHQESEEKHALPSSC